MTEPILLSDWADLMPLLHSDYPTEPRVLNEMYEDHLLRVVAYIQGKVTEALGMAEDHVLGENDHDWALGANGSHVSYPTIAEAFDAAREDLGLPERGNALPEETK